jgi:hypothetical protein
VNADIRQPEICILSFGSFPGVQWRTEGGGGVNPLTRKFRSFDKAEPNSQFRGKYIRKNLICNLSRTTDQGAICPQLNLLKPPSCVRHCWRLNLCADVSEHNICSIIIRCVSTFADVQYSEAMAHKIQTPGNHPTFRTRRKFEIQNPEIGHDHVHCPTHYGQLHWSQFIPQVASTLDRKQLNGLWTNRDH